MHLRIMCKDAAIFSYNNGGIFWAFCRCLPETIQGLRWSFVSPATAALKLLVRPGPGYYSGDCADFPARRELLGKTNNISTTFGSVPDEGFHFSKGLPLGLPRFPQLLRVADPYPFLFTMETTFTLAWAHYSPM